MMFRFYDYCRRAYDIKYCAHTAKRIFFLKKECRSLSCILCSFVLKCDIERNQTCAIVNNTRNAVVAIVNLKLTCTNSPQTTMYNKSSSNTN